MKTVSGYLSVLKFRVPIYAKGRPIKNQGQNLVGRSKRTNGFTLVEVLVAISIISLLMGIVLPVLSKVRYQAKTLVGMNNQKQIVSAVNFFALDNSDKYPESIAVALDGRGWKWQEPMMLTACRPRPDQQHRSISAYLHSYIADASILFSPTAPKQYKYLQQAWDAGDNWINPDAQPPPRPDSVSGTYCFYWNYIGFLEDKEYVFKGPQSPAGRRGQSKLLVSDYFGFSHWRNENTYGDGNADAYGSSVKFKDAGITFGTNVSSDFWSLLDTRGDITLDSIKIKLHAGYTDGHVESYSPSDVTSMRVSKAPDGSEPYYSGEAGDPGIFYLPANALR